MNAVRDLFLRWRNRLLADSRFQDFAASFPLTRPVANLRAREAFDLTAGFVYSQILFACVELDLFEIFRDRKFSITEIAESTNLSVEAADRLARAAAALGLLERSGGAYVLGPHGAALLGNPSVFGMVRHHAALYADLKDPVALLRNRSQPTELSKFWNYADGGSADYSRLMAETQAFIASEILAAYPFAAHSAIMDVGGGAGAFLCAAKAKFPSLEATLCDLAAVAEIARANFASHGVAARVVACDFTKESLPPGADLITLVRVLHDHDDEIASKLLRAARLALKPGGRLLIAEPLAETRGARRMGDAYFGFYLWAMGTGRPRSFADIRRMLLASGFATAKLIRTRRPILTSVVVAG